MRLLFCWLLLTVMCLACAGAHAQPSSRDGLGPAFVLTEDALNGSPLGRYIDMLEDPSGALSLADVQQAPYAQQFDRSAAAMLGFSFTKSAYWLRFQVKNPGTAPIAWILEISYPPLDDIRLFVSHQDGRIDERRTGDRMPFGSREILFATTCFSSAISRASLNTTCGSAPRGLSRSRCKHGPRSVLSST